MTPLERAQYDRAQAERKAAAYDFTSANDDLAARYADPAASGLSARIEPGVGPIDLVLEASAEDR